jgi:hypothetical protein
VTDKLTPERRSENMRKIRAKDTSPEKAVRRFDSFHGLSLPAARCQASRKAGYRIFAVEESCWSAGLFLASTQRLYWLAYPEVQQIVLGAKTKKKRAKGYAKWRETKSPRLARAHAMGVRSIWYKGPWEQDQGVLEMMVSSDRPASRVKWLGSGIANDPSREDDKEYILRLIGQVITVSLETVKIVNALPDLGLPETAKAFQSI